MWKVSGIVAVLALSGCASADVELSRDEQLKIIQHAYPNRTPREVIDAAAAVLKQADGSDFTIQHNPEGFVAYRKWMQYLVVAATVGTDVWTLKVSPGINGKGSVATVAVGWSNSDLTASGGFGGMSAGWGPQTQFVETKPRLFALFWSRVDYMLKLSDDWVGCDDVPLRAAMADLDGTLDRLCDPLTMGGRNAPAPDRR